MGRKIDMLGRKFGMLTVVEKVDKINNEIRWKCLCDCGRFAIISGHHLRSGHTKSCGCLHVVEDLIGKTFGRLTVVGRAGYNNSGSYLWGCLCVCGNVVNATSHSLRMGNIKSCGCLNIENISILNLKHGLAKTPTYNIWVSMKQRCTNKNTINFNIYGGRGIKVCERWVNSFENFLNDMGEKPIGMTIDRIDNNGDYEPNNCKWSTYKEQSRNRRSNNLIAYNGEIKCLLDWAKKLNISRSTLYRRLSKYPVDIAFNMGG